MPPNDPAATRPLTAHRSQPASSGRRVRGIYSAIAPRSSPRTPRLCSDCPHAREIAVLRSEKERFEAAIQGSADGIWDFVPATGELYLSDRVAELLGCASGDLPQSLAGLLDLLDPEHHALALDAIRAHLRDGTPCDFEVRGPAAPERRWLRIRGKAQLDARGVPVRMAGSITDVTQARAAAAALHEAKESAERASRAKTEFLANMSHEIRTPLNAIIGVADLLSEARLEDEQRQYVDMFRRAGSNLLAIVNDILDLSKVEAHKLEIESIAFDLREVVAQAMESVAVRAFERGIELAGSVAPDVPRGVSGDPARLRQILINLLGNAIKFTSVGEVLLDVQKDPEGPPGSLLFSVTDTGIGIPDDKLKSIFERFVQVDGSPTRVQGGTGLGLAICRGLVSLMGGRIWADNRPEGGTSVRFTAVFGEGGPIGSTARQIAMVGAGRRLLVVDDHAATRDIASQMLRELACEVESASTAPRARAMIEGAQLQGQPFDAVVLDARLAPVDGFDLLAWIARRPDLAALTILAMPADARAREIGAVKENGFAGYVLKPLAPGRLAGALVTLRHHAPRARDRDTGRIDLGAIEARRILLVEDNPDNQALVLAYLKSTPHKVTIANNGVDAVARAKAGGIDLVLMDMQMPLMDGYEATRRIRAFEREKGCEPVPILALTAQAMKDESERTRDAGCTGHLTKPITKRDLLHAIFAHAASNEPSSLSQREPPVRPVVVCADPEIADLVPAYLENRRREAPEWRAWLAKRDFPRLRVAAHNLAGSGAAYGFAELTRLGRALQTAATTSDERAATALLDTLEVYLATVELARA